MIAALALALAAAATLLPHGARMLAQARAPRERFEATYLRVRALPSLLTFP